MPKKIKAKADIDTTSGRVAYLLEKVYRGSMTAMGQDLGIHPSSIGNVIHGRRVPGREILTAIGSHPLVNSDWLMHGTGKPIRSDQSEAVEIGLPIAARPFKGLPSENPDRLDEVLYPVSRRLHRPSRYWVRIEDNHPFVLDDELKIAAGDMVLFEPEEERWPDKLTGKPCLAAITTDNLEQLRFGRCLSSAKGRVTDVDIYEDMSRGDEKHRRKYYKQHRGIQRKVEPARYRTSTRIVAVGIFRCGDC